MTHEIESKLQAVFIHVLDNEELQLSREMTAKDVDGWDSLSHIRLIVSIEKQFKIKFRTTEIVNLKNVGQMIDLIGTKLTATPR